ncbi:MAG: protein SCO1/2 [Planctomycetota bacterium]|jgi:protein SCO1/2
MRLKLRPFALLTLFALLFASCERPIAVGAGGTDSTNAATPSSPRDFGQVADFKLTERRGNEISAKDLLGEPWIAGFIFTRCATVCPALTQELAHVHAALEGLDAKVVAFTVDPEHDTAEVLSAYAANFEGGIADNWLFLRGDEERTYDLIRSSFMLGIERVDDVDPGLSVSHSSMLCAVDSLGKIRGYYDGTNAEGVQAAIGRMRFLAGAPRQVSILPTFNAFLNGSAAILLVLGIIAIKAGKRKRHAILMRAAFAVSAAFLISYVYYHTTVIPAQGGPIRFAGEGAAKVAYLILLTTHVIGAVINLPMVLRTLWLASAERWEDHKWWAKMTFPLWLYVSVTGVVVYLVLYVF